MFNERRGSEMQAGALGSTAGCDLGTRTRRDQTMSLWYAVEDFIYRSAVCR
jgi:hypothetical protein